MRSKAPGPRGPNDDANSTLPEQDMPTAAHVPPMPPLSRTRVGKSLAAGRPGTIKLMQRLGPSLLLVRYRYDWTGLYRYTTVELLIDAMPVTRGHRPQDTFVVRLGKYEDALKAAVRQSGGRWDSQLMAWTLPGHAVQSLGLGHRVELVQVIERTRKPSRPSGQARR